MVTFRTEEGLPFLPLWFINKIVWSALGKAYELYKVKVCALTLEPNHMHMLLVVEDPEMISPFVGYVKQETAHGINRLIGRRKKTIWCEGFDSPSILDPETALEKFAYVLLNPVKDSLIASMDQYPGVHTYSLLMQEEYSVTTERIFRDSIPKLQNPERPWQETNLFAFDLEGREHTVTFEFFPYAWKNCFPETKNLSNEEIRTKMLTALKQLEETLPKCNEDLRKLTHQSLLRPYVPTTHGRRMICLAATKKIRVRFIKRYKQLCKIATATFKEWKTGKFTPFPEGLFSPSLPRFANFIPKIVFG